MDLEMWSCLGQITNRGDGVHHSIGESSSNQGNMPLLYAAKSWGTQRSPPKARSPLGSSRAVLVSGKLVLPGSIKGSSIIQRGPWVPGRDLTRR